MAKNLRIYKIYSLFTDTIIIGPIIMLYLLAKGLSFAEIMLVQSLGSIAVVALEVPTGALADKFSRKLSVILGATLIALSLLLYVLASTFWLIVLAEVVFALGFTFKSGADTALVYDSLKKLGQEDMFHDLEGKARANALWMQAVGSIVAGFVYEINLHLPMLISVVIMLITALVATQFDEVAVQSTEQHSTYFNQIGDSARFIVKHPKVKALFTYAMVFHIFYRFGFFLFQPYMQAVNIPVKYFGLIFFVFNMVAALTSRNSHNIMSKTTKRTLTLISALVIVSFAVMGLTSMWLGVVAILLQQMARGLYRPAIRKYLNKYLPSEKRATIMSFFSLLTSLAGAVSYPALGYLMKVGNVFSTHLILSVVMLLATIMTQLYMRDKVGTTKIDTSPFTW